MLIINAEQMRILGLSHSEQLVNDLCKYLADNNTGSAASLDSDVLRRRIKLIVGRARDYGIEIHSSIAGFVNIAFMVGPNFDRHPKIAAILARREMWGNDVIQAILKYMESKDWLDVQLYPREWKTDRSA